MSGLLEPQVKRIRIEAAPYLSVESCTRQITQLRQTVNERLTAIELDVRNVVSSCSQISCRLDGIESSIRNQTKQNCCQEVLMMLRDIKQDMNSLASGSFSPTMMSQSSAPVVILQNQGLESTQVEANVSIDSKMQVITLNKEDDYPEGSWLGDESNPEARVRVPISPLDLIHINGFCPTPEKMALMLLDYLFPRELLAVSNLSGKSKHGKKQLSPLMIYGIRCHLAYKFKVNEKDWYRIKQNMDSKCRTAWRKKLRGLPLGGFKHQDLENDDDESNDDGVGIESIIVSGTHINGGGSISLDPESMQLLQSSQGDIKIMAASSSEQQLVKYQQVIQNDQLLPVWALQDGTGILTADNNGELFVTDPDSMPIGEHQTLALVTTSGEVLMERSGNLLELTDESVDNDIKYSPK